MHSLDVVVIGGGAAGLAAASTLREAGCHVVVVEARDRLGGRMWTEREPGLDAPIELGAEWVHGDAPETRALARCAGTRVVEVHGNAVRIEHGRVLGPDDDFRESIARLAAELDPDRWPDRSMEAVLASSRLDERARRDARSYFEGFHAADLALASEQAIARAERQGSGAGAQGCVEAGYQAIVGALARSLDEDSLRLGTVARSLSWSAGRVRLECEGAHDALPRAPVQAGAAVIALPLGVMRERALRIAPEPGHLRRALAALEPGHVVRVTLALRRPLGELLGQPGTSFVVAEGSELPVWWTMTPRSTPLVVGWRGGPAARELLALGAAGLAERARSALGAALGLTPSEVGALVTGAWAHDWTHDPFSRGAYSYVRTGGLEAAASLSRIVEGTIAFAGEHLAGAGIGTVEGAIASGRRAARGLLAAFGRRIEITMHPC